MCVGHVNMTFPALLERKELQDCSMRANSNNLNWSEVWARRPQLLLSHDIYCSLHYHKWQDIWENKKLISLCDAGEGSVQTIPSAFWEAAALPDFVVSMRILCNNQKPLTIRQQENKNWSFIFFQVSFVGEQFTPTARPHSGSPPAVEKSWVTTTKKKQDLVLLLVF